MQIPENSNDSMLNHEGINTSLLEDSAGNISHLAASPTIKGATSTIATEEDVPMKAPLTQQQIEEMKKLEEEIHYIGKLSPEQMRHKLTVKEIIEFNQKKLKLIEYQNIHANQNQTLEELTREVYSNKKNGSP